MFELTNENVLDYLRGHSWIAAGPAQAEVLSGGVSNQVMRITTPERCFVLKQSRAQLRTRDEWFSDLDRIWREQEVMQALHPSLPDVVPEVLHVDRANYVYAMSHAPLDAKVWKAELLDGSIKIELGKQIGSVLGRIHRVSMADADQFRTFRDRKVFVQLRVDPFYRRVVQVWPDLFPAIDAIIQRMLSAEEALCHGDFTPKNLLVHATACMLVDYETAHFGDPTMDLGLFLAHLTLKAIRAEHRQHLFVELMRAFWKGYCDIAPASSREDFEQRGVGHLGVCLLARVDGTSPVDYLTDDAKREQVRRLARAILLDGVNRWEDVWGLIPSAR